MPDSLPANVFAAWRRSTTPGPSATRSGQPSIFLVRGSPESRYELVRLLPHWDTVHLSVYAWNKTCFKEVTCCLSLLGPHGQFAYLSPSLLRSCSHSRQPSLPLPMSTSSSSAAIRLPIARASTKPKSNQILLHLVLPSFPPSKWGASSLAEHPASVLPRPLMLALASPRVSCLIPPPSQHHRAAPMFVSVTHPWPLTPSMGSG